MGQKVALQASVSEKAKQYLIDQGFEVIELTDRDPKHLIEQAKDAAGLILMTNPLANETIDQMPNLKIIARHGVGFDNVDLDHATANNIWVTITPTANANTVAETTISEIMALSKNLYNDSQKLREGDWSYKKSHKGFDLAGKTLGIMGYGRIGKMVEKKAFGLDMDVLVYDPFSTEAKYGKLVDRDTLIEQSDVITLHLPVLESTIHGFGKREFEMMKSSASIINLGRGALIDEPAMIEALKTNQIGGAALDVFEEEPLSLDSELLKMENVFLTPHIASNTNESMERMALDAANEIVRVLNNEQPQWPVNKL